uniref:Kunitz/Bovine pancreatic trypsin inhibitor domain protein n=1 Tax=Syphacia muris TaxID=451379 RepID=A0A0N5AD37_9BILA
VSGSQLIGEECISDKECIAGGFCENNKCQCSSGHIAIDLFCWRIMEPGETGCVYNEQCSSIWPNAECVRGTCRCPSEMLATQVREIVVCHYIGQCPTNGENTLLYIHNTDTLATCKSWDNSTKDGVDEVYDCDGVGEMYDCLAGVCCPSRAFTCIQPLDIGDISVANEAEQRWYFDSVNSVCKTFNYTGRGGNSNNFLTQQQCQWYCTNNVNKLKPMEKEILCSADDNNCYNRESRYVCCPSSSTMLNFCYLFYLIVFHIIRWYWDPDEQTCKTFMYLGQGGNFNNFLTEDQCLRFCADAVLLKLIVEINYQVNFIAYVCKQPLQEGIHCRMTAPTTRYWFNSSSRQCESFLYNGCKGNLNNFISAEHCERSCMTVENCKVFLAIFSSNGLEFCYNRVNISITLTFIFRYYNHIEKLCKPFMYYGCDGNPNNFETQVACENFCQISGVDFFSATLYFSVTTCFLPVFHFLTVKRISKTPNSGFICSLDLRKVMSYTRYGFHAEQGACLAFEYGGCSGNANNFLNKESCNQMCYSSGAQESEFVLLLMIEIFECETSPCPEGYLCVKSKTSQKSVCCGTPKTGICPRQMFPYVDYYDGSFRLCDPLMKASCPEPFSCFYNADRLLHYCCSKSIIHTFIKYQLLKNCGSLDKCYGHDEFKSGICCTPCPATFELDEKRTNVGECNPLITTSCSSNHQSICLYSPVLLRFVCCRRESRSPTTLVRCPSGTVQDPKHRFCSLDVACPAPYLCVRPNSDHVGICCKPSTSIAPRPLTKRKHSSSDFHTVSEYRRCFANS